MFTIKQIDEQGGVVVSFDVDGVDQHISGLPIHDRELLTDALRRYEAAYARGLRETASPEPHPDVRTLVGKRV